MTPPPVLKSGAEAVTVWNKGCCERCQVAPSKLAYHGDEVNAAKQAAYEASRLLHAEVVGRPMTQMKIRSGS